VSTLKFKALQMKNYKIIENRPELSKEQLKEGMDFNKIKINAGIAKIALLKSILIKGILGIVIVSSGIFIYKTISNSSPESKSITTIDSAKNTNILLVDSQNIDVKLNNETVVESKVPLLFKKVDLDSVTKVISENKNLLSEMDSKNLTNNKTNSVVDTSVNTLTSATGKIPKEFKASLNAKCIIWKTDNYCALPKTAKFISGWDCGGCDYDFMNCKDLDKNLIAVWVTVTPNRQQKFKLENQFKNITLIKSDGAMIHPSNVCIGGENFYGKKFQAKGFVAHFTKEMSVFLFFPEAKLGDKIIIDNFIQAIIEP
jgi:hypothetical protein